MIVAHSKRYSQFLNPKSATFESMLATDFTKVAERSLSYSPQPGINYQAYFTFRGRSYPSGPFPISDYVQNFRRWYRGEAQLSAAGEFARPPTSLPVPDPVTLEASWLPCPLQLTFGKDSLGLPSFAVAPVYKGCSFGVGMTLSGSPYFVTDSTVPVGPLALKCKGQLTLARSFSGIVSVGYDRTVFQTEFARSAFAQCLLHHRLGQIAVFRQTIIGLGFKSNTSQLYLRTQYSGCIFSAIANVNLESLSDRSLECRLAGDAGARGRSGSLVRFGTEIPFYCKQSVRFNFPDIRSKLSLALDSNGRALVATAYRFSPRCRAVISGQYPTLGKIKTEPFPKLGLKFVWGSKKPPQQDDRH
jgi:hypothetical protein